MSLSERITARLIAVDTNKNRLAIATKTSRSSVSKWVDGQTVNIKGEKLIRAAAHLQCSPTWLATGKGDMNNLSNNLKTQVHQESVDLLQLISEDEKKAINALMKTFIAAQENK